MTDDLPQLVQRLDLPWQCKSFDPEGGTECHERHRGDIEAWCSACIVNQIAAALDTLTRALAETAANRDGLKAHADELHAKAQEAEARAGRLLDAYEAQQQLTVDAESALTAMTQERDEARKDLDSIRATIRLVREIEDRQTTNRESITAAVREARAETWASAIGAVEALGESGFFNYAKEKLKAARAGQS